MEHRPNDFVSTSDSAVIDTANDEDNNIMHLTTRADAINESDSPADTRRTEDVSEFRNIDGCSPTVKRVL